MRPTAGAAWVTAALLVASLALGGTVAAGPVETAVATGAFQADEPTPANETTRHEDPREVDDDGDLHAVRDWLAGRMAVQLEDCVVGVASGSVDVCDLEDDYPEWVRKYVDVADDTDDETDDELGEEFEDAAEEAEEYSESVAEFRRTYREYQAARDAGDEARARELARTLQRQGGAVEASGGGLVETFDRLDEGANVDLADGRRSVNATRGNVSAIVRAVEREQFVATALTADLTPRSVSFLEPGELAGRLTTEDGTPVADEPISLVVGDRVVETRTDPRGAFTATYRPTTIDRSTTTLRVRYRPRNASPYLTSETTVPVAIEAVTPSVDVSVEPPAAQFGETLAVSGRVAANGVGVPGVPVAITLDGREVVHVRTDESGAFSLTPTVGAGDGPGAVELRARYPLEGRALEPATGTATVDIERTGTVLRAEASAAGATSIDLTGTLETDAGVPVPDQRIEVRVNGTPVETLRTGDDGGFAGTVAVPGTLLDDGRQTVQVEAAFAGEGTNLDPSNSSVIVALPAPEGGSPSGRSTGPAGMLDRAAEAAGEPAGWLPGQPPVGWLAAGGLGVILAGYLVWRRRRPAPGEGDGPPVGDDGSPPPPATPDPHPAPLEAARDRVGTDPDGAVMAAYATVRGALVDIGRDADTHWEFLAACHEDGLEAAAIEQLTGLTEVYEQAAYAPAVVTPGAADAAIETAEGLLE